MVSLDGALRYVPVAALHDGRQYVAERYGAAVFTEVSRDKINKGQPAPQWEVAALGVSKAHAPFKELPSVPGELRGIVQEGGDDTEGVLPGLVRLDEDFTLESLKEVLGRWIPGPCTWPSHFSFQPGDNLSLVPAYGRRQPTHPGRDSKGRRVGFRNVDLLALSACDTANGRRP